MGKKGVRPMSDRIDFVLLWVDGADPQWQRQRSLYAPNTQDNGNAPNRYRDWGLMPYWFRSVEKFAPWVNRIFFVTNGQIPDWLDLNHPKLTLVKHADYIPSQYLPTFNSNVIELFLHRIPDLSEHFVLFNDDMFLTRPVQPGDFFRDGLPCDSALLDLVTAPSPEDCLPHMLTNNFSVINRHFSKRDVMRKHFWKFYHPRYGKDLLRNLLLGPFQYFSAFRDSHLPSSHTKQTFEKVWDAEPALLEACGANRFRSKNDLTHWLMKSWQICEGNFSVRSTRWGRHYELWEDDIDIICRDLTTRKYHAVCINDSSTDIDFEAIKQKLTNAFQTVLPNPSRFELQHPQKED